ncbi:serine hydrolase domain-containing protein [Yinghuangia sp. YIM S09857]|uniref:serine hydrolase domain-containing protein n=1 Tax=Yinghuangia sp. YIM S09857 TaxID=3436929 RepID=UPI003F531700
MTDLARFAQDTADKLTAQKNVGAVVAAISGGAVEYAGAGRIGEGASAAPDAETLFEIGSVTKVFTSLLLARLAVAEAVHLDEPLADLLPPWSQVPSRDGRHISLEHLATHTSGLPRLPKGMLKRALLRPGTPDPYANCTAEMLLRGLAATKLGAVPGKRFRYSNLGGGLLGLALAERAGVGYQALVQREIAGPLGLSDTMVELDIGRESRMAQGHNKRGKAVRPWDMADLAGAGGLRSTAADLVTFVRAQLHPESSPLGDAVRLSHAVDHASSPFMRTHLGWVSVGPRGKTYRQFFHNGRTGGFASFVGFTPARDVAVVALTNSARSLDRTVLGLLGQLEDAREARSTHHPIG